MQNLFTYQKFDMVFIYIKRGYLYSDCCAVKGALTFALANTHAHICFPAHMQDERTHTYIYSFCCGFRKYFHKINSNEFIVRSFVW